MADVLYVGLQDDDKIVSFGIDAASGKLVPSGAMPRRRAVSFAVSPDRRVLYSAIEVRRPSRAVASTRPAVP
jgi:hypothetical protein